MVMVSPKYLNEGSRNNPGLTAEARLALAILLISCVPSRIACFSLASRCPSQFTSVQHLIQALSEHADKDKNVCWGDDDGLS